MNTKKIKSDGGSSSYYDLPISESLVQRINQRHEWAQLLLLTVILSWSLWFLTDQDGGNVDNESP